MTKKYTIDDALKELNDLAEGGGDISLHEILAKVQTILNSADLTDLGIEGSDLERIKTGKRIGGEFYNNCLSEGLSAQEILIVLCAMTGSHAKTYIRRGDGSDASRVIGAINFMLNQCIDMVVNGYDSDVVLKILDCAGLNATHIEVDKDADHGNG